MLFSFHILTMEVAFIVNVMSESDKNVNLGNQVKEENQVNWLKISIKVQLIKIRGRKKDFFVELLTQFFSFIPTR